MYVDMAYGFYGYSFFMLSWMFQHDCVLYFCICTCSAQLSMFDMERRSRNTLIIIIKLSIQGFFIPAMGTFDLVQFDWP